MNPYFPYTMTEIIEHKKGEVMDFILNVPFPYNTLAIKFSMPNKKFYGAYVTYQNKKQLLRAWVLLLWGLVRNIRHLELSEAVDIGPLYQI